MNMNNLTSVLKALSEMVADNVDGPRFTKVEVRDGQSIEEAVAEHHALHRETCASCAAEHEAKQASAAAASKAKEGGSNAKPDAPRARIQAVVIADINADGNGNRYIVQTPPGAASMPLGTELSLAQRATEVPPLRIPIGFMAFAMKDGAMTPVAGSFNTSSATVHANLAKFNDLVMLKTLREMAASLGHSLDNLTEVRPVYAD